MKYAVEDEEAAPKRGLGRATRGDRETDRDTEITLGTRSLLGIFFGLVLICAVFFGLGYSVGRVSVPKADAASGDVASAVPDDSHAAKPSPQQGLTPVPAPTDTSAAATAPDAGAAAETAAGAPGTVTVPEDESGTGSANTAATTTASQPAATVFPSQEQAPAPTPLKAVTTPVGTAFPAVQRVAESSSTAGTLMVQVAAIGIPQDAEILVAALKRHGFSAVVRHAPTDALLHVQVGPFATKAQAEAMRSRLLADGYNAVIK